MNEIISQRETKAKVIDLNPKWMKLSKSDLFSILEEHGLMKPEYGTTINPNGIHLALVTNPDNSPIIKYGANPFKLFAKKLNNHITKINNLPTGEYTEVVQTNRETPEGTKTITIFAVNLPVEFFSSRFSRIGINEDLINTFNKQFWQDLNTLGINFTIPQLPENPKTVSFSPNKTNPSPNTHSLPQDPTSQLTEIITNPTPEKHTSPQITWLKTNKSILNTIKSQHEIEQFPSKYSVSKSCLRIELPQDEDPYSHHLSAKILQGIENEFNKLIENQLSSSANPELMKKIFSQRARFLGCSNQDYTDSLHTLLIPKFINPEKISSMLNEAIKSFNNSELAKNLYSGLNDPQFHTPITNHINSPVNEKIPDAEPTNLDKIENSLPHYIIETLQSINLTPQTITKLSKKEMLNLKKGLLYLILSLKTPPLTPQKI